MLKLVPFAAAAALVLAPPAGARGLGIDVVATGLDNPRHVAVGKRDAVYVAESGRGGDHATATSCFDSAEGPSCTGATGAVTRVDRHGQERIVTGLASFAPEGGGNAIGPHGIFVRRNKVYVTNGGPTAPLRGDPPDVVLRDPTLVAEDPVSSLYGKLLRIHRHGDVEEIADLWAFERDNNPDAELGNPLVDSNAVDVLALGRRFLVTDAGGNSLLEVTRDGEVRVVHVFPNVDTPGPGGAVIPMQAVPTGVVKGPDGAYYVSQLTGFPFPVGGASVFRVDPHTGEATTYATGFTNIIDLDFDDEGTLHVLVHDSDSLLGLGRDGAIWRVPWGGGTPQQLELPAGTLIEPGGIAVEDEDELYVSNHSREAGAGEVLRIELDH